MPLDYEAWDDDPIENRGKGRRVANQDRKKDKRSENNSEVNFKIRKKLRDFMDNQERPWKEKGLNPIDAEKLKLNYAKSINKLLSIIPIVFEDIEFKSGTTKGGKDNTTHIPTGLVGVENNEQKSRQVVEKVLEKHINLWKQTPPDFRKEFGIIQTVFSKKDMGVVNQTKI